MRIVAVLGISGVGKSTLIERAAQSVSFLHLKASDLIKARLTQTSEQLRQGPVLDNQQLMLEEFADRLAATNLETVVFDGHSIIDTPGGLLEIPLAVFAAIKPQVIVFVEAAPELIHQRRSADTSRIRPNRSAGDLQAQQDRARDRAAIVALKLDAPFHRVASGDVPGLLAQLA